MSVSQQDLSSGRHRVEKERAQFKRLLASNPNYFGNLADSIFKPVKKDQCQQDV
jgi:hypothetical protein